MLLTFEKIREISLNEKQESLQKLPDSFFKNAKEYLKTKRGTPEETSAKNLIENIFNRRQKKILNLCFHLYKTDIIPENLEREEEELYKKISNILKKFYGDFKKNILENDDIELINRVDKDEIKGDAVEDIFHTKLNRNTDNKENIETTRDIKEDKVKVVFIKDIPEVITPNLEIVGFRRGEEKEIDSKLAEILLGEYCKKIDKE